MNDWAQFHFLRPLWLIAIPVVIILFYTLKKRLTGNSTWHHIVEPHLLTFLSAGKAQNAASSSKHWFLSVFFCVGIMALAGPSWHRLSLPLFEKTWSRVFVMDLSLSMLATDLSPDRLTRASFKLRDMLEAIDEGMVSLVVYSGDAFVLSPLTNDTENLLTLIPSLSPQIMPALGSRPDLAIEKANTLLSQNNAINGEIILLTDGFEPEQADKVRTALQASSFPVSILAVGTEAGTPIPTKEGYLKDSNGAVVIPKLNLQHINSVVSGTTTQVVTISNDDRDIQSILSTNDEATFQKSEQQELDSDQWLDAGQFLTLILLPLSILLFRRHFCVAIISVGLLSTAGPGYAINWDDVWLNKNQQAQKAFDEEQHDKAAKLFENKQWKASAHYRAGNYEQALEQFQQDTSAMGYYNQGNAHAKLGQYQESIAAYEEALKQDPDFSHAHHNKQLIEELMKQQEQQGQEQQGQEQQGQEQQGQEQQGQEQQGQEQQGQEQQGQEQQGQEQQGQEQQGQEQQGQEQQGQEQQGQEQQGQEQQGQEQQGQEQQGQEQQGQEQQGQEQQGQEQQGQEQQGQEQQGQEQQGQEQSVLEQAQKPENDNADEPMSIAPIIKPEESTLTEEQKKLNNWLKKIPDEPGKLLQNKMRYEAERRRRMPKEKQKW